MRRLLPIVLLFLPYPADAAPEEVGEAQAVIASASAAGEIGERVLATGAVVHLGDLVSTDGTGEVQLLFRDQTRMVVGANSSLVIDQFLFRGGTADNSFAARALGGAFRFIGGNKGETDYQIRTPSATIGVRGTAFDFTVDPRGGTELMLLEGVASLCGDGGGCAMIAESCGIVAAAPGERARTMLNERERARRASVAFPFARDEERLLTGFRLQAGRCTASRTAARVLRGVEAPVHEVVEMFDPPEPPAAEPPPPPPPPPVEPPPPPEIVLGNPGNPKPVGKAGESPNGRFFGGTVRGRGDVQDKNGQAGAGSPGPGEADSDAADADGAAAAEPDAPGNNGNNGKGHGKGGNRDAANGQAGGNGNNGRGGGRGRQG